MSILPNLLKIVETDYNAMKNMFYGKIPSFEEVYRAVLEFQEEIHVIGKSLGQVERPMIEQHILTANQCKQLKNTGGAAVAKSKDLALLEIDR